MSFSVDARVGRLASSFTRCSCLDSFATTSESEDNRQSLQANTLNDVRSVGRLDIPVLPTMW